MASRIRHDFAKLNRLPPYVLAEVTDLRHAARRAGEDIIDLGMGNPDLPTPPHDHGPTLCCILQDDRGHQIQIVCRGRVFQPGAALQPGNGRLATQPLLDLHGHKLVAQQPADALDVGNLRAQAQRLVQGGHILVGVG